ncbi:ABC transporter permease [Alloacidobacterium dinghuense]|uniref:ABC transporter permease n=1 Tax=Alloacidobacterium dinghuense TaxID=2763107 RepID=UPI00203711F6|nr:ABC transporter permease [Alloacidobacterium dinghuense]
MNRLLGTIRSFWTRVRFLFSRRATDEMDEELQFHIERQVEANVAAGMSPAEARRQALIAFGGVESAREGCNEARPGWFLDTLWQDVRYALRGFRRNLIFTITALATLMLGIGATTAVFSVVDRILFRSLPYAHGDRLVSVGLVQPLEKQEFTLGGFYFEWRDNQKPFASMTFERGAGECNLTAQNPVRLHCADVAGNFLPTLGVAPVIGRNFLPAEDVPNGPQAALISDALWLARYNRSREALNQEIEIDGKPVRIIGVLPADFEMPRLQAVDILLPAQMDIAAQHTLNDGIGLPMWAFARLKPGVSIAQAREEMAPIYRHTQMWIPAQFRQQFQLQIRSIRDRQMQDAYRAAWVLLGAALAVMLIACANVASLFSARGAARERELAVRAALGASRFRIIRQALTEALLLAVAGAAAGCVLAEILLRVFISISPSGVPFLADAQLDLRIIGFAVLLALACAAICGVAPALERPRSIAFSARTANSGAHTRLRGFLVAAQIAVSVVLLSGASLFVRSFRNLQREDLGMQTKNVLTVRIPLVDSRYPGDRAYMDFYLRAEAAMRQLPGVQAVSISDSLPPDGNSWHGGSRLGDFFVVGRPPIPPETGGAVMRRLVTPDYFRALNISMLEGQGFTEGERGANGDFMILSRRLAEWLFPKGDAVGQHIQFANYRPYFSVDGPVFTVVGVAADVKNAGLTGQDDPEYYELWSNHHPESWSRHCVFLIETNLPPSVVATWLRMQIAKLDPTAPVAVEPLTQTVARLADRPRFEMALVSFFAAAGLLLAVVGLYGVVAFLVAQRTQEIGVRMALGATRANILQLVLAKGMGLVLAGGFVGLGVAFVVSRLLRSLLFEVSAHDPASFLTVVVVLSAVALAATLIPALAATKVNPNVALRCE